MGRSNLVSTFCKHAAFVGVALLAGATAQASDQRVVPDTFTAKTTAMTPADVQLKIDIREWSTPEARADAVAALSGDGVQQALRALPTAGYVWLGGSSVGYAVKYAHRTTSPTGERVTFVTERSLGAFGNKPWTTDAGGSDKERQYSVIEFTVAGPNAGTGQLSVAADVKLDPAAGIVALETKQGGAAALKDAKQEPKPYWAH